MRILAPDQLTTPQKYGNGLVAGETPAMVFFTSANTMENLQSPGDSTERSKNANSSDSQEAERSDSVETVGLVTKSSADPGLETGFNWSWMWLIPVVLGTLIIGGWIFRSWRKRKTTEEIPNQNAESKKSQQITDDQRASDYPEETEQTHPDCSATTKEIHRDDVEHRRDRDLQQPT